MNEKEKEMVHQKKGAFNWFLKFWRVSDDRTVAGSLFHDTKETVLSHTHSAICNVHA